MKEMTEPEDQLLRRRDLRRMQRRASGLLVLAAIVFVAARFAESRRLGWGHAAWGYAGWGYIRATAEASMVGGVADWFAVTALFRRPLGLPIPHTALIPTRKDQLGRTLGTFVQQNFLNPAAIEERLASARISLRLAAWLGRPSSPAVVSRQIAVALGGALEILRDEDVQGPLENAVLARVDTVQAAPLAGRALAVVTAEGRHHELVDSGLAAALRFLETHRETLRGRFGRESPWWVPEKIDSRIFDKLADGLVGFLREVSRDEQHELRRYLDERVAELAARLQTDPDLIGRGEDLKAELLAHPAVRNWIGSLWSGVKTTLRVEAANPESEMRRRIEAIVATFAGNLATDEVLQGKIDRWVLRAVSSIVKDYQNEVTELIATTVQRWDPADTSSRIELAVGRDLQFIRINGTVVGGLVGLVIYSLGQLFH